jgi:hypothetical protein
MSSAGTGQLARGGQAQLAVQTRSQVHSFFVEQFAWGKFSTRFERRDFSIGGCSGSRHARQAALQTCLAASENKRQSFVACLLLTESAVPELLRQASDDQIALVICFGAVVVSGLIMHFSIYIGRMTGRVRLHQTPEPGSILMPEMQSVPVQRTTDITVRERAA